MRRRNIATAPSLNNPIDDILHIPSRPTRLPEFQRIRKKLECRNPEAIGEAHLLHTFLVVVKSRYRLRRLLLRNLITKNGPTNNARRHLGHFLQHIDR